MRHKCLRIGAPKKWILRHKFLRIRLSRIQLKFRESKRVSKWLKIMPFSNHSDQPGFYKGAYKNLATRLITKKLSIL